MHWILTVSDSFSLTNVIRQSEWFLCPPFRVSNNYKRLHRVERLSSGHTIEFRITQSTSGLAVQTEARLNGKETEEISQKTWRMLRMGENLQAFLRIARGVPQLASVTKLGGQLLRGTTLFEDIIKALILTHKAASRYVEPIPWIVDHFGDSLPSNPTLHAFPTPEQLAEEQKLQERMLGPILANQIIKVANIFQVQKDQIESLLDPQLPFDVFETNLRQFMDLDDATISLATLYLGRYDYVPIDQYAQQRVRHYLNANGKTGPEEVRALFAPWYPWGGLAYWLWDWSTTQHAYTPSESEERVWRA